MRYGERYGRRRRRRRGGRRFRLNITRRTRLREAIRRRQQQRDAKPQHAPRNEKSSHNFFTQNTGLPEPGRKIRDYQNSVFLRFAPNFPNLRFQIWNFKSEISNLRFQI
jgi:hypothetical protein